MPVVGVLCPYRKNISLLGCNTCEGCKAHGAKNDDFPLILRRKFLFPQFRHTTEQLLSVTKIVGCPRKNYLSMSSDYYMGIDSFKALNYGTAIHEYLEGMWEVKEQRMEWSTPKGNKIFGYFDIINIAVHILWDIKTTGYGGFKVKDGKAGETDAIQVQIYATMLKRLINLELKGLKIMYVGLGDKVCETFDVPFVDRTDFINNQTDYMSDCLANKKTPRGEPSTNYECSYCSFADNCPDKLTKAEEVVMKLKLKAVEEL